MTYRLLPALALPAMALLATAAPPPARAQALIDNPPPAVRAVMNGLRRLCAARHLHAQFVADFLFSVDADGDGRDDDIYLTAAGFSCTRQVQPDETSDDQGHNLCSDRAGCMQWLFVNSRGVDRLVWRGRTPALFPGGEDGLVAPDTHRRYIWNGRALVPAPRRRR